MKDSSRKMEKPVLVLLSIAAALVLAILAGTIWARFTTRKAAQREAAAQLAETREFLDIGRARIQLEGEKADEPGALLIVKAAIPYSPADGQFQEELVRKLPEIREAVRSFFSLYTLSELQATPEAELKAQLLKRLDRILVLGNPEDIYFEEFIFFE